MDKNLIEFYSIAEAIFVVKFAIDIC